MRKLLYLFLGLLLVSVFVSSFDLKHMSVAQALGGGSPEMIFDPPDYAFVTVRGVDVGYRFNATVRIRDVVGLFAWQIRAYFSNAVLNATNVFYHPEEPLHQVNHMSVTPIIMNSHNSTHGYAQLAISALYPDYVNVTEEEFPLGVGVCLFEFEVLTVPSDGARFESSLSIDNSNTYLLGQDGSTEIHCSKRNGHYCVADPTLVVPVDYATIQAAINAANTSDTIFVYNGTYFENVIVNKTLMLFGQNAETVTINGSRETVVQIDDVDGVLVDGFTITGGEKGVYIYMSSMDTISNCVITENSADGVIAQTNIPWDYSSCQNCDGMTISGCRIHGNGGAGITASVPYGWNQFRSCGGWRIRENQITQNMGNGVQAVTRGNDVSCGSWVICDNNITGNCGGGLFANPGYNSCNSPTSCSGWIVFRNNIQNNGGNGIHASEFNGCNCDSWNVKSNDIMGNGGDGIRTEPVPYSRPWWPWPPTAGGYYSWLVSENRISDNAGTGIRTYGLSDYWSVWNNSVRANQYGICIGGNYYVLRRNEMANNTYNFGVVGIGIHDIDTTNTVDEKPVYYWMNREGGTIPVDAGYVGLVDSANVVVKDLVLSNNEQGLLLIRTQNITLENFQPEHNVYGFYVRQSSDYSIQNCLISNHTYGVFMVLDINMTLTNVTLSNNTSGAIIQESVNTTVQSIITEDSNYGVLIQDSSNASVCTNTISNCTYGLCLQASSNTTVVDNRVINNYYGVFLDGSENNTVCVNEIGQNSVGVFASTSSNNQIYNNNIDRNNQQASASGTSVNSLDAGYSMGGNYWSDFNNTDECMGMYQNETGSDGIADSPYVVNQYNIDHYPLASPWSTHLRIILPGNTTYRELEHDENSTNLLFTTDFDCSWVGYSLDDRENVTIVGNTTLTGLTYGSHHINVYANDTYGNTYSSATVFFTLTFLCDVNYDRAIDVRDLAMTCHAYGSVLGDQRWQCKLDFNHDSIVDIFDVALVAIDYGRT